MKKIFLIILTMAFLTSCEDSLDIAPNDSIDSNNAFKTVEDLQVGLNAVYRELSPDSVIEFSSIFTDDTKIGADSGGQGISFHNQILNANTGQASSIWTSNYRMINSINRLLAAAEDIPATAAKNKILGDCYALRAYGHFTLLQFYSEDYNSSSLAVPYVDFVGVYEQPNRNTVAEVFGKIKEDLNSADSLIDSSYYDVGFVTSDFILALRARMALYEGVTSDAINYTNDLIARYPLANQNQYLGTFDDANDTEVIFKYKKTINDGRIGGVWFFTGTGGAFFEMSNGLYNSLDDNDVRKQVLFDEADSDLGSNLLLIGKYRGTPGNDYLNDVKVFRSSEMVLINAEAKAKASDLAGAAEMIKQLRDARFGSETALPSYGTLQDAITDILSERRLELAYEGHRYLDLKRTRDITNVGIDRDPLDCGGAVPCSLAPNDHRFTLPIPTVETNGNTNISQNSGY